MGEYDKAFDAIGCAFVIIMIMAIGGGFLLGAWIF